MSKRFFVVVFLALLFLAISFYVLSRSKNEYLGTAPGCGDTKLSGEIDLSETRYVFNGEERSIPKLAFENQELKVLGTSDGEKWIEVDLSQQKLYAWERNRLFLESDVSTGLPWWPTPEGEFRIWLKLRATKMEGGSGKYYYYLPNVPYVMFFENTNVPGYKGYGLHGTYWHNDFGNPHSHGCVNLPTPIAEKLYYWTEPVVPEGKWFIRTEDLYSATRVVIHK